MGRLIGVCMLALSIASTGAATVVEEPACCYCVVDGVGQTPFCGLITSRAQDVEITEQCLAQGGFGLKCLALENGQAESTCNAALAEEGVSCPIRSGAPTASAPALGALALVFAAVGVFTVRRRAASASD